MEYSFTLKLNKMNIDNSKAINALKTTTAVKKPSPLDALKVKSSTTPNTPVKSIPETTAQALKALDRVSNQATTDLTHEEQAMVNELLKGGRNMTGKMEIDPTVVKQEKEVFGELRKPEVIDELLEKIENIKENPEPLKKPKQETDFEI